MILANAKLRKFASNRGFRFSRKYGYVTNISSIDGTRIFKFLHEHNLKLSYADGCFHPYLCERN